MDPQEALIAVAITKEIVKDAYQDTLQPTMQEIGKNAHNVSKLITIALTPVSAMVWGYEQIKTYVQSSLEKRLKNVSPENITPPDISIAGPTLEALRYTGHKKELREMFANLLATSMDSTTAPSAHPSFVEIIKQLSPDEAKMLTKFQDRIPVPIVSIRAYDEQNYYSTYLHNFSTIAEMAKCEFPRLVSSYIENLTRLGLTEISYVSYSIDPGAYDQLLIHPTVTSAIEYIEKAGKRPEVKQGVLERTNLGKQFHLACIVER